MKPTVIQLLKRGLAARSFGDNAAYALGRFYSVRRAYSLGIAASQKFGRVAELAPTPNTLFPQVNVEEARLHLERTSAWLGLRLPQEAIDHIRELALSHFCGPRRGGSKRFKYADVVGGRLPDGDVAVIGDVIGIEDDVVIDQVARDPTLLAIVSRYIGYRPTRVDKWLHWSFASSCPDDERRHQGQTIDYHYDVHGYNFIYVSFYVSDCDERSGAHVFVERSHKQKPVRWLLDTSRKSDAEIREHYGEAREHLIVGRAGDGFVEDTSCFHKALIPIDRDRLLLQLRYL
jgi:hypothetical protein